MRGNDKYVSVVVCGFLDQLRAQFYIPCHLKIVIY